MSLRKFYLLILLCLLLKPFHGAAQVLDTAVARKLFLAKDTIVAPAEPNPAFQETDSAKLKNPKARTPRQAAIRSAILPGLGQAYNKHYWKIPIVYAALGATGWYFGYNLQWYKRYKYAYKVAYYKDTTNFKNVYIKLQPVLDRVEALKFATDQTRRQLDYAAIYFLVAWALNVVEASVDAHLSTFDISPNLSVKLQPGFSELAQTHGISLVLNFK